MTLPAVEQPLRSPASAGLTRATLAQDYDRDRLGFLLEAVRQHGPVVQLAPGTVLVAAPAAVRDVLRGTGTSFFVSRNILREEIEGVRGEASHDHWLAERRSVLAEMRPTAFGSHRDWLARETGALCDRWIRQGEVTDPTPELAELTSRSFARFAFGDGRFGEVPARTQDLLDALFPILSSPFELPRGLRFLPRYRRMGRAHAALREELRRGLAGCTDESLAGRLLGTGMNASDLVGFLVSMHSAGSGVPAAALTWALVEMARHPDAADELAAQGSAGRFVDEVLRLWPPTWLIMRETRRATAASGWRIPADTAVLVSPYVVHRVADCYIGPEEFRPARWHGLRPPAGAYLPFGAGPRRCLGAGFAQAELTTVVSVLAERLQVELADPDVRAGDRRTLSPRPCALVVRAR